MLKRFVNLSRRARSGFARPIRRFLLNRTRRINLFFRSIFGHKNIKKVFGTNLAVMLIASSFIPAQAFNDGSEIDNIVVENIINLNTKVVIQYPVEKIRITQGFRAFHPGLDLDGLTGDNIRPIEDGTVAIISHSKYAYGNAILIEHADGISSLYAHLSKIFVVEGQTVDTKTVIGEMGATGHATGDHLHFEIRKNGIPINPYTILPKI